MRNVRDTIKCAFCDVTIAATCNVKFFTFVYSKHYLKRSLETIGGSGFQRSSLVYIGKSKEFYITSLLMTPQKAHFIV